MLKPSPRPHYSWKPSQDKEGDNAIVGVNLSFYIARQHEVRLRQYESRMSFRISQGLLKSVDTPVVWKPNKLETIEKIRLPISYRDSHSRLQIRCRNDYLNKGREDGRHAQVPSMSGEEASTAMMTSGETFHLSVILLYIVDRLIQPFKRVNWGNSVLLLFLDRSHVVF